MRSFIVSATVYGANIGLLAALVSSGLGKIDLAGVISGATLSQPRLSTIGR